LKQSYDDLFSTLENPDLDDETFLHAAELRARYGRQGLKTPDALHLAVAQLNRCSALWTNDERFAAASQGLAIAVDAVDAAVVDAVVLG